ncbi:hypothetical protein KR018_003294 [Drosophila ironensis]|nr:hypothetical protein KR018_003294 [Drosophila ironensis]
MNSSGELHPNWLALTTLPLQLKRFVRAGEAAKSPEGPKAKNPKIRGIDGTEAQSFYKEVLDSPETSSAARPSGRKEPARAPRRRQESPFDCGLFFRWATANKVQELSGMEVSSRDVDSCDSFGWTALMMAACEGAAEAVAFLLRKGADPKTQDKSGNTALTLARRKGHLEIVALLEEALSPDDPPEDEEEGREEDCLLPYHCEVCNLECRETPWPVHQTSTLHQFNLKRLPAHRLHRFNIPARNKGLQLMVKQGWDQEHGLGPHRSGRLYPVKTVLRRQRTGLGIQQEPAKVTHFGPYDSSAVRRRDPVPEKRRTRSDMQREKVREWKRERHLRRELS